MARAREQLQRFPLFASAAAASLDALAAASIVERQAAGSRFVSEGDPSREVFLLTSGRVGVFYSSDEGADVLVKVFSAPAVFGEMEQFFSLPRLEYVESFDDVELVRIEGAAFRAFLEAEHRACLALLEDVAARLCISAYNERALVFQDVEMRVAGLFLTLLEAYGRAMADGNTIVLETKLTYRRIAQCVGATEKSVERTIGKWLEEGWLDRDRTRYRILDREALSAHADPDRLSLHFRLGGRP